MDEFVKKALKNTKIAQIPPFDDNTESIIIPKLTNLILQKDKCYLIELDPNLLDPNSTIMIN